MQGQALSSAKGAGQGKQRLPFLFRITRTVWPPSFFLHAKKLSISIEAGDARHDNPAVLEGSKEWDLIVLQNRYDMELYMYAEHLYNIQARDIFGVV